MTEVNTLAVCACRHAAYEHHFSGYQDFKGDNGRGKCSHNTPMAKVRCACVGFRLPEAVA